MDSSLASLKQQREHVLEQMQSIDRLRRGSLSCQFFKQQRDGKTHLHGPYYVLQSLFRGKKCSERIPADKAAKVGEEVQNYQRFQELAEGFVTLTDRITQLAEAGPGGKKNSSRTKSPRSVSEKPKPS